MAQVRLCISLGPQRRSAASLAPPPPKSSPMTSTRSRLAQAGSPRGSCARAGERTQALIECETDSDNVREQPRTPLPTSHAHPLSPPLDPPTTSFLPDLRSDLLDSRSDTNSPLFPASPPDNSPTAELRRGSVATLLARTSSSQGVDGGIGLGLPAIATSRSDSRDRPPTINSSGTRSRATSSPSPPPSTPLPQHLSFPSPPHTLQPAALTSLPLSHLVALAQALSAQLEEAQATLREGRAELQALETLAADKGAGEGELERAKVRARTELREKEGRGGSLSKARERAKGKGKGKEEWRIELPVQDGDVAPEVPAKVEVRCFCGDYRCTLLIRLRTRRSTSISRTSPRPSRQTPSTSAWQARGLPQSLRTRLQFARTPCPSPSRPLPRPTTSSTDRPSRRFPSQPQLLHRRRLYRRIPPSLRRRSLFAHDMRRCRPASSVTSRAHPRPPPLRQSRHRPCLHRRRLHPARLQQSTRHRPRSAPSALTASGA